MRYNINTGVKKAQLKTRDLLIGGLAALSLTLAPLVSSMVSAAGQPVAKNSLTCSAEPTTNCSISGNTATITNIGGAAAVYLSKYSGKSFYSKLTSQVTTLQNNVGGSALGIDPRWSIPIDVGNDGDTNFFAFVSFADCNNGSGLVDVIHDSTCTIYRDGVAYANWAAMVAANPNDRISYADFAFIIADGSGASGTWGISNVKVGSNT
ncbi:MAG TPA: hypothetical protein VLE51_02145 [Candidatus Saccharimonadales bacterium]|nr:hypothetical protein [Candidatus Saccharimonadales bacterium]